MRVKYGRGEVIARNFKWCEVRFWRVEAEFQIAEKTAEFSPIYSSLVETIARSNLLPGAGY